MKSFVLLALTATFLPARPTFAEKVRLSMRGAAKPSRPPKAPRAKYVLVISIDGLSWRAFRRHRARMPRLRALARKGSARPLRVTFPSMTWAAHASLLTGQYPRYHGVLGNRWYEGGADIARPYREEDVDAQRRKRTPAITDLVAAKGDTVATLNWPMTQGAKDIDYNLPEFMHSDTLPWSTASPAVQKLLQARFRREARGQNFPRGYLPQLVGRMLRREGLEADLLVRDLARDLVAAPKWLRRAGAPKKPPKLMLVHFLLLDSWLHRYGNAPFIERWAVAEMDRMLGSVLAAYRRAKILDRTAVFVVSDHGFAEITHTFDLRRVLRIRGVAPHNGRTPLAQRNVVSVYNGHVAFLYLQQKSSRNAIVKLLGERQYASCLEKTYTPDDYSRLGLPLKSAQGNIPPHRGAPDLIVMTRPHCTFGASRNGQPTFALDTRRFGHHGYLPTHPHLRGVLVAAGAGLERLRPRARIPAEIVDIAPTIAHLLALAWPTRFPGDARRRFVLDGRVLSALITGASPTGP